MNETARVPLAKAAFRRFAAKAPGLAWFMRDAVRLPGFLGDYTRFSSQLRARNLAPLRWRDRYICLRDKTSQTAFDRHYVYHTAWAARCVRELNPKVHVDIASSLFFCSMVSAFVPVRFYDFRPPDLQLSGLECERADLMGLPFEDNSIESLSCLHTIEHVGLGRYGDPLDVEGDIKAIKELKRVVSVGGTLLIAVPVGKPRIQFNAHRIYGLSQIVGLFPEFDVIKCDFLPDRGAMVANAPPDLADSQKMGCGCFAFRKRPTDY